MSDTTVRHHGIASPVNSFPWQRGSKRTEPGCSKGGHKSAKMNPSGRYNTTQSTENQHKPVFHGKCRSSGRSSLIIGPEVLKG